MISGTTTIEPGVTFLLHGMIGGDLLVKPEGIASIYGTVSGIVRNMGGEVEIFGTVDEVIDHSNEHPTAIDSEALVRKRAR